MENKDLYEVGSLDEIMYLLGKMDKVYHIAKNIETEELMAAAETLTDRLRQDGFGTCSIINAKSGRCSEDCRWCAQSAHWHTSVAEYPLLDTETVMKAALDSHARGIGRFSFVTSGRRLSDVEVDRLCATAEAIREACPISLCISGGLLDRAQMQRLKEAGVSRYHCNLEAAPSIFGELCTTHSQDQKIETLKAAREAGMDICSGGIIGMGETEAQRIELAFVLKGLDVKSVPINVLNPIKGTPLENQPKISDEEVLRTVALFRLIMPDTRLRFAGGIARFSAETLLKAYRIGINAAIMGDMLTTAGTDMEENFRIIRQAGYPLH